MLTKRQTTRENSCITLWVLCTLLVPIFGSCGTKPRMTVDEVKQLVGKEAPVGSTKSRVLSFLDKHQIQHSDYSEHPERESDFRDPKLDSKRQLIKGLIKAIIRNVGGDERFTEWSIEIFFYFDDNGRLLDYNVKGTGTSF